MSKNNKNKELSRTKPKIQAEDDVTSEFKDTLNDVFKQELMKNDKELSEIIVKFNKMKENNNELEKKFENLIGENKKEYERQLEEEKRNFNLITKTLAEKVQKLEGELSDEKRNNQNTKKMIKKEYERQLEKEKQVFDSKLKTLDKEAKCYQKNYNQLKERYDELQLAKENMDQQLRDREKNFKLAIEKYKNNIENIRQILDERENILRELEDNNFELEGASGIGNSDQNHSVNLKQDILKLQNTLENYVTHLKPNMDLNIKEIQKLAQEYGCLIEITEKKPNKIFIKAILQRKVLDLVRKSSHNLIKFKGDPNNYPFALESDIESKTDELLRLIKLFIATRAGTDEVTDASIIKIRQQVYEILGNRGFNNIIDDDGNTRMHDFIAHVGNELNEIMNRYRKINDLNRKEQVDAMAPKLVEEIYKLFWFRINVQEPKTECKYFQSNSIIDPDTMKGTWNDDEIDKLRVDVCYFPVFGRDFDSSDVRIYTHAKVFPRNISVSKKNE
ncbi:hypothetical protein RclHR1_00180006 [Rhizophagus clarus]|uniref:Uncharacterized protein n=1 Tax=Rhizophagus clarus TaxID=94130 RepID=A0A2Z6REE8_9GLOM|nr:hypothetical protein RclHR1_00180006 [Rhizophagus clarus]GES73031.1 hypothetical protein GLOIN_2v1470680 [Rhizophagus clarus]